MKFRCLNIIYITSTTCIDTSLLHSLTANSAKPIGIDLRHHVCDKYWVLVRNVCQRVVRRRVSYSYELVGRHLLDLALFK